MKSLQFRSCVSRVVSVLVVGLALPALVPAEEWDLSSAPAQDVVAVQESVTGELMAKIPEIIGTAVGQSGTPGQPGQPVLLVFVDVNGPNTELIARALPAKIGNVKVSVERTTSFRAMPGKPGKSGGGGGDGVSHTAIQPTPIKLGTSGGWSYDLANGYCCGGTLGSLISVNGQKYILSNYHVFESDVVPGGNGLLAQDGDPVIQPALIDVGCIATGAQPVATLQTLASLPDNNVDVSVAKVIPGQVDESGAILEIGPISAQTVGASMNKAVKKSGRTTGLSTSKVTGLNATISVAYNNECAGGVAFTKTFTGQIILNNTGSKFLSAGDSGSLMVENAPANPKAVGLLYAGSSSLAVANPIDAVLSFIGSKLGGTASMVGN